MAKDICPICKQDNNCALKNNRDGKTCWCNQVKFTENIMKHLKYNRIEDCICKHCHQELLEILG